MTQEVKTQVDDMKDFAHQAKLELGMHAREGKLAASEKVGGLTGHESSGAEKLADHAAVKLANARDVGEQAKLEAQIRGRDAKLAFDKSETGHKINEAASAVANNFETAKEAVIDATTSSTKTVEATSTRGVNITHIENSKNASLEQQREAERVAAAKEADRAKEVERQALVDSAKAKAAVVQEKGAAVGAVLSDVADRAAVVLGKAVVSAKNAVDDATADPVAPVVQSRQSTSGVDISSASNPRNDELNKRDELTSKLSSKAEPSVGEKLAGVGASIKAAYTEATTDAPNPLYAPKMSASGVDISHVENSTNADIARREQAAAAAEKEAQLAHQKDVLKDEVVDPALVKAHEKSDSLAAKFEALGDSLLGAAKKVGAAAQSKYNELAHPVPVDVHEKTSERGIDTTSIANADNHAIGEAIKAKHDRTACFSNASCSSSGRGAADDSTTTAIKATLDGGVAARHAEHQLKADAKELAHDVKVEGKIAAHDLNVKAQHAVDKIAEKTGM